MILTEPLDILSQLEVLELELEPLLDVIRAANRERALVTRNDPRGFDLIVMNAKCARGLRDRFCGPRWVRDELGNQAGIRNPHLKVRVIHCNLDANTCNPFAEPKNIVLKGSSSSEKVARNDTGWLPGIPKPEDKAANWVTWVLGTYFSTDPDTDGELRAEISCPKKFAGGRYRFFEPRVFLLNGADDAAMDGAKAPERSGPTEVIDIAVKRK